MIRVLTDAPAQWDAAQLFAEARSIWPDAAAVNEVDGRVALYLAAEPEAADVAAWEAVVAAHAPTQPPDPAAAVRAAVATARQEVAGYAPTNGTRQAVESLCNAVETLVQGA